MRRSTTPQQQRVVSTPQSPQDPSSRANAETNNANGSLRRKGSFNFLRRSKSRERTVSAGSAPPRKLSKKERSKAREQDMSKEQIPQRPPRIPRLPHQPELHTFGGEHARPDSVAIMSNRAGGSFQNRLAQKSSQETIGSDMYRGLPIPPVPPVPPIPGHISMSESMTHRGRYSYASSAISTINSPRKIRRRKDPTPFNILVLGAKGSGKTAFLNFLRTSLTLPAWKQRQQGRDDDFGIAPAASEGAFPTFTSQYVETEIESERIGVTLWDSEGLEANVVDLQLKEITTFIESKFEDTFTEESKVARAPGFRDTHIHCTFLVLDPVRLDANVAAGRRTNEINGVKAKANSFVRARPEPSPVGLDESLDLNVLRALKGKTTVIPVIAKADTITVAHMAHLKRAVWDGLKTNGLETLDALTQNDDDDESDVSTEAAHENLDERDEDAAKAEDDKFSVTSHLDSPSDSSSSSSTHEFYAAYPTENSKTPSNGVPLSPRAPSPRTELPLLPLSIISPDPFEPDVVGRRFPWGFADPYNAEHCDFTKLKETVFTEWKGDLREASRELWYEGWRTSRLNKKSRRNGTISLGINEVRTTVWSDR